MDTHGSLNSDSSFGGEVLGAPYMREDELLERLVGLNLPEAPISKALAIAREVHGNQKRDDGASYLEEHVYPVAHEVARFFAAHSQPGQLTATLVAILHDSMEDSTNPQAVRAWIEAELGEEVARFVEGLTKPPKSEFAHLSGADAQEAREAAYMDVVRQLPASIRLVKVLDRMNNLLCVHKSPSKIEGYVEETIRHHLPLAASVDPQLVEKMGFIVEALQERLGLGDAGANGS